MRKASFIAIPLLLVSGIILIAASAFAADISIVSSGKGVYILQGTNLVNVGGFDATITYDAGALTNPRVEKGSVVANAPGNMFIVNTKPDGVIRLGVLTSGTLSQTGPLAILTFEKIKNSPPPSIVNSNFSDPNSNSVQVAKNTLSSGDSGDGTTTTDGATTITDSGNKTTDSSNKTTDSSNKSTDSSNKSTGGGTTTTTGSWLGTVTMPGQEQDRPKETAKPEEPVQYQAEEPRVVASIPREPETPAAKREEAKPGEKKFVPHKSLLQQIREWKEPVTPQSLLGLFNAFTVPGARQEPEVALSDGKTKVKVYIDLPAVGKQSPNFALKGAKLISLKNEEKDRWVLEALPVKNSNDVKITALQDNVMTEIPLAVAQPMAATAVTKDGKLDPAAFALFLKERGTDKAPQFDLNGDKTRNYIDDYIFTANYIVKNGIKKTASGAANKGAENAKTPAKAPAKPAAGK